MDAFQWDPGAILELSGYYWKTCALHAAVTLEVFTAIGDSQPNAAQVAQKINADTDATARLLNALVAMQLLTKSGDTYANTAAARSLLVKDSCRYLGHIILHHHHLMTSWSQLDRAIATGAPVRSRASFSDEQWRESFLMGMFNLAMGLAPRLVPRIDLSGRRHLLDLGGGPGTYSIHFCQHNPRLNATVYDLPTTRPFAEKTIKGFKLENRINFVAGDYLADAIGGSYDVAWLSHILHGEGPGECRKIIAKTVGALQPGGMIIIHDFILNNSLDGPLFATLFSLNMLLGTRGGRAYSEQQIMKMMSEAGVRSIRRIPVQVPNDSGIISGTV